MLFALNSFRKSVGNSGRRKRWRLNLKFCLSFAKEPGDEVVCPLHENKFRITKFVKLLIPNQHTGKCRPGDMYEALFLSKISLCVQLILCYFSMTLCTLAHAQSHTCTCTVTHLHTCTCTVTHLHMHSYPLAHLHMHNYTLAHLHMHNYTLTHLHMHNYTLAHLHMHNYTLAHLHMHSYTLAHAQLHTCTHNIQGHRSAILQVSINVCS